MTSWAYDHFAATGHVAEHGQVPERKPGEPCPLCTHEHTDWNKLLMELIELGLGDVPQERITPEMIARAQNGRAA